MANVIKIKKGLDINLAGKAPKVEVQVGEVHSYGVVPDFFPWVCAQVRGAGG